MIPAGYAGDSTAMAAPTRLPSRFHPTPPFGWRRHGGNLDQEAVMEAGGWASHHRLRRSGGGGGSGKFERGVAGLSLVSCVRIDSRWIGWPGGRLLKLCS